MSSYGTAHSSLNLSQLGALLRVKGLRRCGLSPTKDCTINMRRISARGSRKRMSSISSSRRTVHSSPTESRSLRIGSSAVVTQVRGRGNPQSREQTGCTKSGNREKTRLLRSVRSSKRRRTSSSAWRSLHLNRRISTHNASSLEYQQCPRL